MATNPIEQTFAQRYEQICTNTFTECFGELASKFFDEEFTEERRAVRRCRLAKDLRWIRNELREYGVDKFKSNLVEAGILEPVTHHVSTQKNIFAKFVSGQMIPFYGDTKDHPEIFFAHNLKEYDDHVYDATSKWLGKASFSETHKFIVPRDLTDWTLINGLTLGIRDATDAQKAIDLLCKMKTYAIQKLGLPEERLGFFLHIYPFNSIQLLHLHVIDMTKTGPTYSELSFKNLPLDEMLIVLREEAGSLMTN